jgi:hypothetical protein
MDCLTMTMAKRMSVTSCIKVVKKIVFLVPMITKMTMMNRMQLIMVMKIYIPIVTYILMKLD